MQRQAVLHPFQNPFQFQSSPALWGRCNRSVWAVGDVANVVSILTGPLGPVQRAGASEIRGVHVVSILTGPLGPVQPRVVQEAVRLIGVFQSSPALWGRCNFGPGEHVHPIRRAFQSSPALWGRCNPRGPPPGCGAGVDVSILTGPLGPVQHVIALGAHVLPEFVFQSSPALWGRCNPRGLTK